MTTIAQTSKLNRENVQHTLNVISDKTATQRNGGKDLYFSLWVNKHQIADKNPYEYITEKVLNALRDERVQTIEIEQFNVEKNKMADVSYFFATDTSLGNLPDNDAITSNNGIPIKSIQELIRDEVEKSRAEMEYKHLQEKYLALEKASEERIQALQEQKKEFLRLIDTLEDDIDALEDNITKLKEQAHVGKNILSGVKEAMPRLMENPKVLGLLAGIFGGADEDETPIQRHTVQAPKGLSGNLNAQEESEEEPLTEEELMLLDWALSLKTRLGAINFGNLAQINEFLAGKPEMLKSINTFILDSVKAEKASKETAQEEIQDKTEAQEIISTENS
jgi:hypothetical protein